MFDIDKQNASVSEWGCLYLVWMIQPGLGKVLNFRLILFNRSEAWNFQKVDFSRSLGSTYSYGRLDQTSQPLNRHFVPRLAKLNALGGESITFYQQWRQKWDYL